MAYGAGVYVDIGSNHPFDLSNTFFFDRCLGWRGLCIEPNVKYHKLYGEFNRTCTLVPHCVLDKPTAVTMTFDKGVHGRIVMESGGAAVATAAATSGSASFLSSSHNGDEVQRRRLSESGSEDAAKASGSNENQVSRKTY